MRSALSSRSALLRMLATIAAVALVIYLLSQQGWDEIRGAVSRIQVWRFLLALLFMFFSRFFVAGRWHVLLRSGGVNAGLAASARITFAGLFANNFLPTTVGGDVARLGGALQHGFDGAVSAASLVVDRLVGLLGMSLALPFGLQKMAPALALVLQSEGALAAIAAESGWVGRMLNRARYLVRRVLAALRLWLRRPGALLAALLFTLLHMLALFLTISLLLGGMGEELPFLTVAGLWSLVYLVSLLPFTINALGLQEVSVGYAFTQLGGIDPASSLALAILIRTLFMLASLPGALFLSDVLPGVAQAQPILKKLDV